MEKEHWKTKVIGIRAESIEELAKLITEINLENWVIATQPIKTNWGYDALVFVKLPPEQELNNLLGLPNAIRVQEEVKKPFVKALAEDQTPTKKQLDFLKRNKFKIESNLTKTEASRIIKEFIDRLNREESNIRRSKKEEDYIEDY